MGNSVKAPKMFNDCEHATGKRLIASILANERDVTQLAIDFARKEFTQPFSSITSNASEYEEMTTKMEKYLTKHYDVGDGIIFRKTPLEYCETLGSTESAAVINENLQKMGLVFREAKKGSDKGVLVAAPTGIESATVGTVTQERALLAKSRLQAFKAAKNGK